MGVGVGVGGYVGDGVGAPWALTSETASVDTLAMESETLWALWALTSATVSVDTSAVELQTLWALASATASVDTSARESWLRGR